MERVCRVCNKSKPLETFAKDRTGSLGYKLICLACTRVEANARYQRERHTPEFKARRSKTMRRHDLKRKYGITPERYDEMLAAQGGACAICRTPKKTRPHIDHCHKTGKVGMLLCHKCNQGLGYFDDSAERLKVASWYIENHRK